MGKASVEGRLKGGSDGRLYGVIAVVLAVGLIVGFGLGFKVEQSRIRTKNKHKKKAAVVTSKTPKAAGSVAVSLAIGKLGATTANTVTVSRAKGPALRYSLGKGSLIRSGTAPNR